MKISSMPGVRLIIEKPWLLVVGMFTYLLIMWITVFTLSVRHPVTKLDSTGEKLLLERVAAERNLHP